MTREQRFWAKVNKTDCCWLWTGGLDGKGYGQFWVPPKLQRAHRFAWSLAGRPDPEQGWYHPTENKDGYQIDHLCRVRRCVNPSHLEAVPPNTNMQRQAKRCDNTSGTTGVVWHKGHRKWLVQVRVNGNRITKLYVNHADAVAHAESLRLPANTACSCQD